MRGKRFILSLVVIAVVVAIVTLFWVKDGGYNVGDYYYCGDKEGIVFEVWDDGRHGKIVALHDAGEAMTWEEAQSWCQSLGDGWHLPFKLELMSICRNRELIGNALSKYGRDLSNDYYWSITRHKGNSSWFVNMHGGFTFYGDREGVLCVRAVSTF